MVVASTADDGREQFCGQVGIDRWERGWMFFGVATVLVLGSLLGFRRDGGGSEGDIVA
jgi:hypothetical protein